MYILLNHLNIDFIVYYTFKTFRIVEGTQTGYFGKPFTSYYDTGIDDSVFGPSFTLLSGKCRRFTFFTGDSLDAPLPRDT